VVNRTVSAIWEDTPFDWPASISGGGPFRWKDPQPDVVSHIAHQSAAPAPPRDTTTTHCGCMRSADLPPDASGFPPPTPSEPPAHRAECCRAGKKHNCENDGGHRGGKRFRSSGGSVPAPSMSADGALSHRDSRRALGERGMIQPVLHTRIAACTPPRACAGASEGWGPCHQNEQLHPAVSSRV
jgi:hypothetical protein